MTTPTTKAATRKPTNRLAVWTIPGNASLGIEPMHGWVETDPCVETDDDGIAIPGWSVYAGEVGDEDLIDSFMDLTLDGEIGNGDASDAIEACEAAKEQAEYDQAERIEAAAKDEAQVLLDSLLDGGKALKVLKALRGI